MRANSSNLDLIRTCAVSFVVISHLPIFNTFGEAIYHTQALGLRGVLIFFVHTCLVLMLSLERQEALEGRSNLAAIFFVRRVFRIYPLSIAIVLILAVFDQATSSQTSLRPLVSNIFLIQNITGDQSQPPALWSLPFEVQMYLLLPVLYFAAKRADRSAPIIIAALWAAAVIGVLLLWRFHINYDIVKFIPCFIPGVLAFTLSTTKARQSAVLLFAYIMLLAILFPVAVALGEKENLLAWPICLGLGLIIPRCRDVEVKFMTNIGRVVAKYSYGIYIVHGPCIDYVFKVENGLPQPIQWISFFALTSILSYFAYHAIEKPCIELGRRGAHRWLAQRQLRAA